MTDYLTGKSISDHPVPQDLNCDADQYYSGMPLSYREAVDDVDTVGTGDGTATLISANGEAAVGNHVITFSAALVAEILSPDGQRTALAPADGAATAFVANGLSFTLTDGATAWVSTDSITIAVAGSGAYGYDAVNPEVIAFEEKLIASELNVSCLVSGSSYLQSGIVDDSGDALTVTRSMQKKALLNGIVLRKV